MTARRKPVPSAYLGESSAQEQVDTDAVRWDLEQNGLLPNRNGVAMGLVGSGSRAPTDPRIALFGRDIAELARHIVDTDAENERLAEQLGQAFRHLEHTRRALDWIRSEYTLDQVALDVIQFALDE